MAGETIRTEAICLAIHPWSRTSHIVRWLTPRGRVTTVVKGAERPKSFFLGQYDLNYTCDLLYYAHGTGELHALRECAPVDRRDALRGDYRALVLAEYYRLMTDELAPQGPEAEAWYDLLTRSFGGRTLSEMLDFDLSVLHLAGVSPDFAGFSGDQMMFSVDRGAFVASGRRQMPVSRALAACLRHPRSEKNLQILLDAARLLGVYYNFHLEISPERRRTVLRMISDK